MTRVWAGSDASETGTHVASAARETYTAPQSDATKLGYTDIVYRD